MNETYMLILILGAMVAISASIGIIGVLSDVREKRRQRAKHKAMAGEAALLGWEYQAGPDTAFELTGRSRDGIRWRLSTCEGEPGDADGGGGTPASTVWSTDAIATPYVALYVTKRSEYKHMRSWLGRRTPPPLVQLFLESAREITTATPEMDPDYMVLVNDETLGYQVFGPETQAAYSAWLRTWHQMKRSPDRFTIQLGGQNLSIETPNFIDSTSVITPLAELGQALARSYGKAPQAKVPPHEQILAIGQDDGQLQAKMQVVRAFERAKGKQLTDEEARYLAQHFRPPLITMILGGFFLIVIIAVVISLFHSLFNR